MYTGSKNEGDTLLDDIVSSTSLLAHTFIGSCLRRLLEWFAQGDDQKAETADQRPDHDCSTTWLKSNLVEAPSILLNENGKMVYFVYSQRCCTLSEDCEG